MSDDGADDRTLLTRHAAGDANAFGELLARHRDRLWRVALRTLGDPDDAADALQDAWLSAFRAAGRYRGEAAVTTWLHRIVVNACVDLVRRRTSRPSTSMPPGLDLPDPAASGQYDVRDTSAAVLAGLRQLPVDQAAAVVLVDVEGFSVREAAEILDVPEGTVKSRCARARARLADVLSDLGPGNPPLPAPVQREQSDPPAPGPADDGGDLS